MYKFLSLLMVVAALATAALAKPQVLLDYGYYAPGAYVAGYTSPLVYSYPYAYAYSYPYAYV